VREDVCVGVRGVVVFAVRVEVRFVGRFELLLVVVGVGVGRSRDCARGGDVMRRVSSRVHHVQAQARKGMSKALLGFDKNNGFWDGRQAGVGVLGVHGFL
jgi:hypothetical protein